MITSVKINSLLYSILVYMLLSACKTKDESEQQKHAQFPDTSYTEKKEIPVQKDEPPPVSYNYTKVVNNRYNFSFELPESWKAIDKSNNGDGYYLDAGDINVDFRIYGQTLTGIDDIDNTTLCDAVALFTFTDGTEGKKCTDSGLLYFFYTQKNKRVTLYLNATITWKKKNINAINHIAESISMKKPA